MIVALYALALAMIVGGLLAAILGWDIVLVERGWTMVISGIVGASSGALLIGITLIVSKLARIQQELARVQLGLEDDIETVVVPTPAEQARGRIISDVASGAAAAMAGGLFGSRRASAEPKPTESPVMGEAGNAPAETAEETRLGDEEPEVPFELRSATPDEVEAPHGRQEPDEASEAKVPDFLFAERYRETIITETFYPEPDTLAASMGPDRDLTIEQTTPADTLEPDHEDVFVTETSPATHPAPEPEPEADQQADAEQEEPATDPGSDDQGGGPATVVGTYNSGENKYVMFSDGSIEAETPQGFFRFASLDELKEFISAGGEGSSASST